MSDDEDDYMSADILRGVTDQPVGVAKSRCHQRQLRIHARFEESKNAYEKVKKITPAEREKERRDEALAKPIGQESKGFALMAKMGFKPGMTLGKKRENSEEDDEEHAKRLKVPLGIDIKVNRKGLGQEAEEVKDRDNRVEQVMKQMKEQAARHEELIDDYQKRRKLQSNVKQVLKDVYTSRKVCEELDHRKERKTPKVSWYWRSFRVKQDDEPSSSSVEYSKYVTDKNEDEEEYKYSNGLRAPTEIDFTSIEEESLREKLDHITYFLRDDHFYCIWCGANFESDEDMKEHCPGDTRNAHHGDDHD